MRGRGGLIPFRNIRKNLKGLAIHWDPRKGKGSHGSFVGPHQKTRATQCFPIPRHQQQQMNIDYIKALRRRFGLTDAQYDDLFT